MQFFIDMVTVIIVGLFIVMLVLTLCLMRGETNLFCRIVLSILSILVGLIIVFIATIFMLSASAAENSATAPAESAVTVQGYTGCPTEFNPDDSAWAMNRIESAEKKIDDNLLVIEHIRIFGHMWLPKCAARLYSYGSLGDSDGKRVFAIIKSPDRITAFLLTDKGWERGNDIETFTTNCSRTGCDLTFALYQNKEMVASRTVTVRQFSHFREPVE